MNNCIRILLLSLLLAGCCQSRQDKAFEKAFVNITDVVPDAILEIRYFGTYNFVGTRIDGYLQPTALLTKEAAAALKDVSDEIINQMCNVLDLLLELSETDLSDIAPYLGSAVHDART